MQRLFDPDAIRAQITNLTADRARIDRAIESLEDALRSMERRDSPQVELAFDPSVSEMTLHDAVKRCCMAMSDGITRQGVIKMIEANFPNLHPKSASVAASLVNLTKGEQPVLKVAVEGKGRSPSFYTTAGNTVLTLSKDEIDCEVDQHEHQRRQQDRGLDQRIVALCDGADHEAAEPRQGEHLFDHDGTAEEIAGHDAHAGGEREIHGQSG